MVGPQYTVRMANYFSAALVVIGVFFLFTIRNGSDYHSITFLVLLLTSVGALLWNFFKARNTRLLMAVAVINLLTAGSIYYILFTTPIY